MKFFDPSEIKKLFKPQSNSSGEDNGQVTVIGGSDLFHGAPLLSLKVASKIAGMVFFSSPEPSVGRIAEQIKSRLLSFIWVPWGEIGGYIEKSDSVLIGPGMKRFGKENESNAQRLSLDKDGAETRKITKRLLKSFPNKKWVIDAGSLQTMEPEWIPDDSIITPNLREFEFLFGVESEKLRVMTLAQKEKIVFDMAQKHKCVIVLKGMETVIASRKEVVVLEGGNPGLNKGGTGDVLAGLAVALLAKNDPFLAVSAASYVSKVASDSLYKEVGANYSADDLSDMIPETLHVLIK